MASDPLSNVKIVVEQGGDNMYVKSGGTLTVESGGTLTVAGVTIDATTLAMTGLTATAVELNQYCVSIDVDDASAETSNFINCPHAGTVDKIYAVVDSAINTADVTITSKIATQAITTGVVTLTQAGSAAGTTANCSPSAAKTVTAGQAIEFVVSGGGSAGTGPRLRITAVITR